MNAETEYDREDRERYDAWVAQDQADRDNLRQEELDKERRDATFAAEDAEFYRRYPRFA
jgi:hypothetical protein